MTDEPDAMGEPDGKPVRIAGFNVVELVGGGVLSAVGIAAAIASANYGLGTLRQVGPGMFPMCLGIVLALMGVAVIFDGRRSMSVAPRAPWRPILAICAGLAAFGLLVERMGAIAAIVGLVVLVGFAEPKSRPKTLAGIALAAIAFMSVLAWAFYGAVNIQLLPE